MISHYSIASTPIGASPIPATSSSDVLAFDGFGLQNANIITSELDFDDTGSIELNSFKYPRENGGGVLSKFYRERDIKANITLKANTAAEFSALLDTFKKSLAKTEGQLDIVVAGETRTIKATVTRIDFNRKHYNVTFATAQVTFKALEPFFYSKSAQSFWFEGKTSSFSDEFTNSGSAPANPALYFIFGAGSSVTSIIFSAFWKSLEITEPFTNNDILIIDSGNKSITKNGVEIDYTGQFPQLLPGSCPFTITIGGTVLADITFVVPKNYI